MHVLPGVFSQSVSAAAEAATEARIVDSQRAGNRQFSLDVKVARNPLQHTSTADFCFPAES